MLGVQDFSSEEKRLPRHRHAPHQESCFTRTTAHTGAVTLILRFGSALNPNLHVHMLFLDGVYLNGNADTPPRFHWVKAPTNNELTQLIHRMAERVGRFLERQGLLERDIDDCMDAGGRATHGAVAENDYLSGLSVSGGRG